MVVRNYISGSYPVVDAYSGVNAIHEELLDNNYLVVLEQGNYSGILTANDLIERPHKLVIDCLTDKPKLSPDDSILAAMDLFSKDKSVALPVFNKEKFIGVVEKKQLLLSLKEKIVLLHKKSLISENSKSQFLRNLSHEIRTPLNVILGFLNILADLDIEDFKKDGLDHFNIVRQNADHFLIRVNDLVELALIHSGDNISIHSEPVVIENIFTEIKDHFEGLDNYKNKKVVLEYLNTNAKASIHTDYQKTKHILYHLVDNAVKFSPEQGKVTFGVKSLDEGEIIFIVTNNNNGRAKISDEKKIFELFEKDESTEPGFVEGLGTGLTIVKELIDLLKGKVWIDTNTENETAFYFSIPIQLEHQLELS